MLNQVVTAAVAVLAAISGAGVNSWINRRNTLDTLAAARDNTTRQILDAQDREHSAWLRNQKQEAYVEFLASAEGIVARSQANLSSRMESPPLEDMTVLRGRLRLLASDEVLQQAETIDFRARLAVVIRMQLDDIGEDDVSNHIQSWQALGHAAQDFQQSVKEFVKTVRSELGMRAPEDLALSTRTTDQL